MSTSQFWMIRRLICPICISENGISKCLWELREYDVCHLHGCYMVGNCHACNRPVQWACASKDRCVCGVHLIEFEAITAPRTRKTRCRLLANAASETLYGSNRLKKIAGSATPLDWFFLFEYFIRWVLKPGFSHKYERILYSKSIDHDGLVLAILRDKKYCRYLQQVMLLQAASDPMTMTQTLRSDKNHDEMQKLFRPCLKDMVFHDILFKASSEKAIKRPTEILQSPQDRPPSHSAELRQVQDSSQINRTLDEEE